MRTGPRLSKGAAFGQFDAMAGPSERLMIGGEAHMGTGTVRLAAAPVAPATQLAAEEYKRAFDMEQRGVALPVETVPAASVAMFRGYQGTVVSSMYDVLLAHSNVVIENHWLKEMVESRNGGAQQQPQQRRPASPSGFGVSASALLQLMMSEDEEEEEEKKKGGDVLHLDGLRKRPVQEEEGGGLLLGTMHLCPTCKVDDCRGRQCARCHQEMKLTQFTRRRDQQHHRRDRGPPQGGSARGADMVARPFTVLDTAASALPQLGGGGGGNNQAPLLGGAGTRPSDNTVMVFEEPLPPPESSSALHVPTVRHAPSATTLLWEEDEEVTTVYEPGGGTDRGGRRSPDYEPRSPIGADAPYEPGSPDYQPRSPTSTPPPLDEDADNSATQHGVTTENGDELRSPRKLQRIY